MALGEDWQNDPLVMVQDAIWPASWCAAKMLALLPATPPDVDRFLATFDNAAQMLRGEATRQMVRYGVKITAEDTAGFESTARTILSARATFATLCAKPDDPALIREAQDILFTRMQPAIAATLNHFRRLFISLVVHRQREYDKQASIALTGLDRISKQIFFISINASVEAARAGEAGRGFSQISTDIRALSQSAQNATRDLSDLVTGTTRAI